MKTLIIYSSVYGNTKRIAEKIAETLGKNARVMSVADFKKEELEGVELFIVGSPIHGWRPSEELLPLLKQLEQFNLKGIKVAAFDTRIKSLFSGDAASKIAKSLTKAGAALLLPPEKFIVTGKEGQLAIGELERAVEWANKIAKA